MDLDLPELNVYDASYAYLDTDDAWLQPRSTLERSPYPEDIARLDVHDWLEEPFRPLSSATRCALADKLDQIVSSSSSCGSNSSSSPSTPQNEMSIRTDHQLNRTRTIKKPGRATMMLAPKNYGTLTISKSQRSLIAHNGSGDSSPSNSQLQLNQRHHSESSLVL